ncbi:hypothetical protein C5745_03955 [Sphingobacterium haloxyli]|uniref:Uncharacterized protein n=1 Tax=Sphingobacterium haloxyli TaxID=2100533 RepID=A0A2S9J6E9_9SPHI|nr:hypothetical protein C5745_03955 [Sphingobacterium haloxyli]
MKVFFNHDFRVLFYLKKEPKNSPLKNFDGRNTAKIDMSTYFKIFEAALAFKEGIVQLHDPFLNLQGRLRMFYNCTHSSLVLSQM